MEPYVEATRKLHKHMKQMLKECGNTDLMPPVISSTDARIESIGLSTRMSAQGGVVYTYKMQCTEKPRKMGVEKSEEDVVPLVQTASSLLKIPGKVLCDGPCGRVVDFSSTIQFGCDHSICENCRKTSQSVACFDGSPGCCNEICVALGKAEGGKTRAGPDPEASDSKQSLISNCAPVESLHIHVSILKSCSHDVMRTQLDYEFASTSRISALVKALRHYKDLLDDSRFYYSLQKPKTRADLKLFSLTETHLRFYDIAGPSVSDIYFLIVANGVRLL